MLSVAGQAGATTILVTAGSTTSTLASMVGMTTADFNSGTAPSQFTFTGNAGVTTGSKPLVYLQPGGDSTSYAYVGPGGSISETLGAAGVGVNYFGLYWGSPDAYNSLTFTDTMGNQVVYGAGGIAVPTFTQYQGNAESYVEFNVSGNNWVSVTWNSFTPAFEFDNVTSGILATPEPASVGLLGLALIGLGAAFRRRGLTA